MTQNNFYQLDNRQIKKKDKTQAGSFNTSTVFNIDDLAAEVADQKLPMTEEKEE